MYEIDKKTGAPKQSKSGTPVAKTSHTLNPVPCILFDPSNAGAYRMKAQNPAFGLSNIAATTVNLLGYEAPDMWDESLIEIL